MIERIPLLLLQMIPFLMAIVFHEVGHALVAKRFGDDTAENLGRLTLNPIPHIDPVGTLLFPALNILTGFGIFFGWAKPVPINFNRLRPYRKGLFLTALGGPGANFILSFVIAFLLVLLIRYSSPSFYLYEPLKGMAIAGIQINFALAVFNLIPLPPLDGSRMVSSMLSHDAARTYDSFSRYSFIILLGLLWSGVLNILIYPIQFLTYGVIGFWQMIFGI